jgi:hypothetical protein
VTGGLICGVCGTVNVGVFARCIACGQELERGVPDESDDNTDTASREKSDVPLQQENDVTGPVAVKTPPSPGQRPRSSHADEASQELDSASYRQTVIEMPRSGPGETAPVSRAGAAPPPSAPPPNAPPPNVPPDRAADVTEPLLPPAATHVRFVARLLLPEGDRRSVELGPKAVTLGSGLDELGLPGDPRVGAGEAHLWADDGRVWVEPRPDAQNVYRRIDREMKLADGDVVLMGDVAAMFRRIESVGPVDGARQVLGGSANAPCGRLVFLRRDGSPGPVHDLPAGKTVLGRTDGHLNFPNDSRLSRRHALFFASDQGVTVEDMDSRNGTYMRLRAKQQLEPEDALRVGSAGVQIRTR